MHKLDFVTKAITKVLFDAGMTDAQKIDAVVALAEEVYEDGYDQAAHDITMKIQSCIPAESRTVADARYKGAWTDAGSIALNHIGKLSNPNYKE